MISITTHTGLRTILTRLVEFKLREFFRSILLIIVINFVNFLIVQHIHLNAQAQEVKPTVNLG